MTSLREKTASDLVGGFITAHDQKFYDSRMSEGEHGCYLTNVGVNRRKGSLSIVVKVEPTDEAPVTTYNSKLGKGRAGYYTVRIRWDRADEFMGDIEDWLLADSGDQLWRLETVVENADIFVWSNSIDWFMQGRWEWAAEGGYSYYQYSGPENEGRWLKIKGSKKTMSKHMIEVLEGLLHKRSFVKAIQAALNFVYGDQDSNL